MIGRNLTSATLEKQGLHELGARALQNCQDLLRIIRWNADHNILLFRQGVRGVRTTDSPRADMPPTLAPHRGHRTWDSAGVISIDFAICSLWSPCRLPSGLLPRAGTYDLTSMPQHAQITAALRRAGDLARACGQRLTMHPSHYVQLGTQEPTLKARSMLEVEAQSQARVCMGLPAGPSCMPPLVWASMAFPLHPAGCAPRSVHA